MKKIVLASNNPGKLREFEQLFIPLKIDIVPQKEFSIEDADETGLTFVENALIKARHAARISQLPAIADDSGIVVDALNGAPGIYSARYSGEHGNDQANNEKLLANMVGIPPEQRGAHFHCTLVYLESANDPEPVIASANWYGSILTEPKGNGGFGYNPLFFVPEFNCSVAELHDADKNRYSHRGQALDKLIAMLKPLI
jgi:XTP/dITP diphosphohydrolase